jgi:hypothetical protein
MKSAPVVPRFSSYRLVVEKLLYGRLVRASWMYSFMMSIVAALILLRRCRVNLCLHYTKGSESLLVLVMERSFRNRHAPTQLVQRSLRPW